MMQFQHENMAVSVIWGVVEPSIRGLVWNIRGLKLGETKRGWIG